MDTRPRSPAAEFDAQYAANEAKAKAEGYDSLLAKAKKLDEDARLAKAEAKKKADEEAKKAEAAAAGKA